MSYSASSSASSSSDSDRAQSPPHPRKKPRLQEVASSGSQADSDIEEESDSNSDSPHEAGSDAEDEDAPVLSHAQKRKEKKKEQRVSKSGGATAPTAGEPGKKVKNSADLPPSKLPKRQNSIWVGNLSFKTTPDSLRGFFEGVGEITRIHMPTKMATGGPESRVPRKENRGFAYVDFATPDAKLVAISLSENPLDGRRLLIKDGDDFKGRPAHVEDGTDGPAGAKTSGHTKTAQKILSVQKQPAGPTLFLGNLGFETTQESIRELFESHRSPDASTDSAANDKWLRKIRLGTFEDSGKCKGWAFVDFTSTEHATAALTNPRNHHLNGRKLVVEYASPDAVRRGGGGLPRADKDKDKDKNLAGAGTKRERPARAHHGQAGADAEGDEPSGEYAPPAKKRRWESERGDGGGGGGGGGDEGKRARSAGKGPRPQTQDRRRAKPGAALALAKREDVAIVPSQGKKIVF